MTFDRMGQLVVEEAPRSGGEAGASPEKLQTAASLSCGIPTSLWDSAASDVWDEYVSKALPPEHQVMPRHSLFKPIVKSLQLLCSSL